jgi:predicted solute-binding protein
MLRIGCVKYLNARPLIYGWPGKVDFDHPAALCRKLEREDLDVALVSSLEFLRRPIYRMVDGISISSRGPVHSVVVAHREELAAVRQIELDPASETSVALLQCLLAERGLDPRLELRHSDPADAAAQLLIGDQAIRFRQKHSDYRLWDLGEEWKNIINLPFVFALWLIRPEIKNAQQIAEDLRQLRDHNLKNLHDLISTQAEVSPAFCQKYYQEHLLFDFGEREKAGLHEFHRRCLLNKIDVAPDLRLNLV